MVFMAITPTQSKIRLPDFTRWQWASQTERLWWAPLFKQTADAYQTWERQAVVMGKRKACWQPVHPKELVSVTEAYARYGVVVVPTNTMHNKQGYSSSSGTAPGDDFVYRCVFTRPEHLPAIFDTKYSFDEKMGRLLGYPICCQRHFNTTWGRGQVDSTFEQWQRSEKIGLPSTLMRWMGIRAVSHLPCRYDCIASTARALDMLHVGEACGHTEEVRLIKEVLKWPVQWSRLFGIAEITSPATRVSTRTDWTPTRDEFVTDGIYNKPEAWIWTDNGFIDPAVMRATHSIIIESLKECLPQGARLLDLGAGNGHLARRLTIHRPDVKVGGVEFDKAAIAHAPQLLGKWFHNRIEDNHWTGWHPDAVLINPVRLLEMGSFKAFETRQHISGVKQVFLYAYPDTLKDTSLEQLAVQAGFMEGLQMLQKTPLVSVGLLTNS